MRIDADRLARDAGALVAVPSETGDERAALARLGELAAGLGLEASLRQHDLVAVRADPGHPGEETERSALLDLVVTLAASEDGLPRVCLDGHVDVVGAGTVPWSGGGPWSGRVSDGHVHGRGSVDMKGGVVAALHALAALRDSGAAHGETVLLAVGGEEDGGLGTFAALRADARFDAALIPEPTGLAVVPAQAGALTFTGVVRGRAAHAAMRLEGESAIDRYLPVHQALHAFERTLNADVEHPLMRSLELPYPVLVGRLSAGTWSSSVPDRLEFEGRVPVRLGETVEHAQVAARAAIEAADPGCELRWTGGMFAPGETDPDGPLVRALARAATEVTGAAPAVTGVPWGADLRLFTARGIPCAMYGPRGIELAHGVDERVRVDDLVTTARVLAATVAGLAARA